MTWNSGTMGGSSTAGVATYPPPDVPGRRRRPHPAMQDREGFYAQLWAYLPASGQQPVSTKTVAGHFGLGPYHESTLAYPRLARWADEGLVERIVRPGEKALHWRRTAAGEQTSAKSSGNAVR